MDSGVIMKKELDKFAYLFKEAPLKEKKRVFLEAAKRANKNQRKLYEEATACYVD